MSKQAASARLPTYFIPGAGIDREVITTDICRYLGNDALVKPGNYKQGGEIVQGYFITAYRALTTDQLTDIKADSARWAAERSRNPTSRQTGGGISPLRESDIARPSNLTPDGYRSSATRARQQQWAEPPSSGSGYPPQMQSQPPPNPGYDPYGRIPPTQPQGPYGNQPDYGQAPQTNYIYGPSANYGVAPPPLQQPRTSYPQGAGGYQDGRGMNPPGYAQDNRPAPGYYEQTQPIGRGQNIPTTQPYQPREAPQESYNYGRGLQQQDEPMEYDYEEDYTEQQPPPPPATGQSSRHREAEPSRRREKHRR